MSTIRLYEEKPYDRTFKAKVISADEDKLILDKTLFYAESGGQPGDTGIVRLNNESIKVINTVKSEDGKEIIHVLDKPLNNVKTGDEVEGEIDWDRRYRFMKNHTALHILVYGILKETGAMVTGGQIGEDGSRMDFNMEGMDREKMEHIIKECDELAKQGIDVYIDKVPYDEFVKDEKLVRTLGANPPKTDFIRVINLGNLDRQACGGTHLKNTSEISSIKLKKMKNKGKNNKRLYIEVD